MFDLPTLTPLDRKIYRKFHKELIKLGFYMFQYSIYVKLALNRTAATQIKNKIKAIKPAKGNVSILEITEKQFNDIDFIVGSCVTNIITTTDKIIIIED